MLTTQTSRDRSDKNGVGIFRPRPGIGLRLEVRARRVRLDGPEGAWQLRPTSRRIRRGLR